MFEVQPHDLLLILVSISLLTPHLRSNPVIHCSFEPPRCSFSPVPSSPLSRRPGQPQPPGAARRRHRGLGAQPRGSRRCPRWGGKAELGVRQLSLRAPTPSERPQPWPQAQWGSPGPSTGARWPCEAVWAVLLVWPPSRMGTPGGPQGLTCCCWACRRVWSSGPESWRGQRRVPSMGTEGNWGWDGMGERGAGQQRISGGRVVHHPQPLLGSLPLHARRRQQTLRMRPSSSSALGMAMATALGVVQAPAGDGMSQPSSHTHVPPLISPIPQHPPIAPHYSPIAPNIPPLSPIIPPSPPNIPHYPQHCLTFPTRAPAPRNPREGGVTPCALSPGHPGAQARAHPWPRAAPRSCGRGDRRH